METKTEKNCVDLKCTSAASDQVKVNPNSLGPEKQKQVIVKRIIVYFCATDWRGKEKFGWVNWCGR